MSHLLSISYRPVWAVLCPSIVALLILLSGKRPNLRESWTLLGSAALCLIVLSMPPFVLDHGPIEFSWFQLFPGIAFSFKADALGLIFATTSSCLWILVSVYSIGYMRTLKEHAQTRYYFSFAVALVGAMGVALSANLVTMFIFYEILTISTYPLVAHHQDAEGYEGGRKYLIYLTATAKMFLLPAMILIYVLTGTLDFADNINAH